MIPFVKPPALAEMPTQKRGSSNMQSALRGLASATVRNYASNSTIKAAALNHVDVNQIAGRGLAARTYLSSWTIADHCVTS